jgi:hypothetical protein
MAAADTPYTGGGLTGATRDAAVALNDLFTSYGLKDFAPLITNYLKQGYSADTVSILLQNSSEYKQRFAGNDLRIKAGLPVLSPAEYLATERAYGQVLQKYGLPQGFYDNPADYNKWIGMDVSPTEIDTRAKQASDFLHQADPQELAFFKQHYTTGDMIAYALDPNRAAPLVGKAFQASQIGGKAADVGVGIDQATAEQLANNNINEQQAQQGFGQIAQESPTTNLLSALYGNSGNAVNQKDLIDATFLDNSQAQNKIKQLASQERGNFGGASGVSATTLSSETSL